MIWVYSIFPPRDVSRAAEVEVVSGQQAPDVEVFHVSASISGCGVRGGFWSMAMSLGGSALLHSRGARKMFIPEAKKYLGRDVSVTYRDRRGELHTQSMRVHDVTFVPMYGGCLVGDIEDVWLDKITNISAVE